ncbi:N-acetylglucosamine kinase [Cetobacterium sp.]|uniref:N-acetylglucosamine kinase n=1 Tax=Cetobacterium sp. TaxID=2071632 RepID=UPI003F34560C
MYYIGVDGGGTKTKFVLVDEKLEAIAETERGTTHLHQIGIEKLKKEVSVGVNEVCNKGNVKREDIEFIFLGIPGYGESIEDKKLIENAIKVALEGYKYKIDNDCVSGWAAGTRCEEGINIIAGTGSMVFGMNDEGKQARVGGWGPTIGDDGSAHWIGIKVINEYTKQKDRRHKETILTKILEEEKEINSYFGIVDLVFNKYNLSRTELAKFSIIGSKAAKEGCIACEKIFEEAAYELYLQVKALKEELDLKDNFILSYSGGVFNIGDLILKPLEKYLIAAGIKCIIKKPSISPAEGSALMAYKLKQKK